MAKGPTKRKGGKAAQSEGIRKGRFQGGMDPLFAAFNASISFDKRMSEEDVRGGVAHVRMLGRQGIISEADALAIEQGLVDVLAEVSEGRFQFREELEDVHINIEDALRARIGEAAGRLHTARSRNDQVALDLRMHLRSQTGLIMGDIKSLAQALVDKSEESIDLVLPGYTHLQRAQPVRLSHHLMAYFQMFKRDWLRYRDCLERMDELPLGSAALAGTTFAVDRDFVAKELGFSRVSSNSMDAVSDRDFAAEFLFDSSMAMTHLSRFAEELILWSTAEFGFCSMPDEFCSGSSIMPQKKNPDACELIRGKTGRVFGDLVSLLTTLKALPLTYNKDLQEDKEPVFDAIDTVRGCLRIMAGVVRGLKFHGEKMLEAASDRTLAATDIADRLTREGLPFREAHARTGAMMRPEALENLDARAGELIPTPEEMVEARGHKGGTARSSVMDQIVQAKDFLNGLESPIAPGSGKGAKLGKD